VIAAGLTFVVLLVAGILALAEFRRTGELLTPWSLFLALAVYDVLAPAAVMLAFGLGTQPDYIDPQLNLVFPRAVLLFTTGAILFGIAYHLVDTLAPAATRQGTSPSVVGWTIREPVAIALYCLMFTLQVVAFRAAVAEAGSLVDWGRVALTTRFRSDELTELSFAARVSSKIGMPVLLAMTGVLFQLRARRPLVYGVLLPILTFVLASLTLLRGNVLNLMLGLSVIAAGPAMVRGAVASPQRRGNGNRLLLGAVAVFLVVSVIRNLLTDWAWGVEGDSGTVGTELVKLFRGDTLIGIASIMNVYGTQQPLLAGKTIVDMALLPVPRAIYTSKPAWYGIDDITRAMGWPTSTQSAVGMPGELFANFAYIGVIGMIVYGVAFALFRRLRGSEPGQVVYGFVLLPAMFATFWMGFTGFVSQLSTVPVLLLVFAVVYSRGTAARGASQPVAAATP
jgi:hypothetical protein